jgi:DNA repair exonuclease SbcCD ATPase subunit
MENYSVDAVKKLDNSVLLWAGIGPFVIMLTLFVGIIKGMATMLYLPFVVILGIPVCLFWKREGMIAVVALTVVALILGYDSIKMQDRLWMIGWTLTLVLDVLIMGIAFTEAGDRIRKLQKRTKQSFRKITELDEQIQKESSQARIEREKLETELDQVTGAWGQGKTIILSHEKLISVLKEEHHQLAEHKEQILEDLLERQKETTRLRQQVQEFDALLVGKGQEGVKAALASATILQDKLRERNFEVDQQKRSIERYEDDLHSLRDQNEKTGDVSRVFQQKEQSYLDNIEELKSELELSKLKTPEIFADGDLSNLQESLESETERANCLQVKLEELEQQVSIPEKVPLTDQERYVRHVEGVNKQLRGQFEEKNSILHRTRSALFSTENELLALKKGLEESNALPEDLHRRLETELVQVSQEKEVLEQEIAALENIVSNMVEVVL